MDAVTGVRKTRSQEWWKLLTSRSRTDPGITCENWLFNFRPEEEPGGAFDFDGQGKGDRELIRVLRVFILVIGDAGGEIGFPIDQVR